MQTWASWRQHAVVSEGTATYSLGTGRPLTFLHGYPSSSHDIEPVWQLLDHDAWHLLTLDLPGFGASAKQGPYAIHAAADAVERLWSDQGITQTVLLAHDYSVSVAQELLARDLSVTLDRVVLLNGGLYPDLHRQTVAQQLLLSDDGVAFAASMTADLMSDAVAGTWGTRLPYDPRVGHEMWNAMVDGAGPLQLREMLHYVADRRQHADRWRTALETTDVPLAFVWGDLDPVSGAHVMERLRERFQPEQLHPLADVGHWPLLEAPDEVAAVINA